MQMVVLALSLVLMATIVWAFVAAVRLGARRGVVVAARSVVSFSDIRPILTVLLANRRARYGEQLMIENRGKGCHHPAAACQHRATGLHWCQ